MTIAFTPFHEIALSWFGSEQSLSENLPTVRSVAELEIISDDRYLSAMCLRVFRAGMKHSAVDAKWRNFDQVFDGFEPSKLVDLSDEELEGRMNREGLIKHWAKVKAIRANASLVLKRSIEFGGFGHWIASWPVQDIIGLWADITDNGVQMGGNSAPAFLRYIGKDTFLLTDDVVNVLTEQGLISGNPNTKDNLAIIQRQFNAWQDETGLPLSHISKILSYSANQAIETI